MDRLLDSEAANPVIWDTGMVMLGDTPGLSVQLRLRPRDNLEATRSLGKSCSSTWPSDPVFLMVYPVSTMDKDNVENFWKVPTEELCYIPLGFLEQIRAFASLRLVSFGN